MSAYQSRFLFPSNIAFDATFDQTLSFEVQGSSIDKYRIRIYDMEDDSLDFDTGDIILSPVLYSGQTVEYTLMALSLTNGKSYKWNVQTFSSTQSATTSFATFKTNTNPIITFNVPVEITSQSYLFEATYTQSEDVAENYSQFFFYDVNDILILTTEKNYIDISYLFEGFSNGRVYKVKIEGQTDNGVFFSTPIKEFSVLYGEPNISINPTLTQDKTTSFVTMNFGELVQLTGEATGDVMFEQNKIVVNDRVLAINDSSSYVDFLVGFTEQFSTLMLWKSDGTPKEIATHIGTVNVVFGYDGTRFYITYNTVTFYSDPISSGTFVGGVQIMIARDSVKINANGVLYKIIVTY